MKKKKDQRNKFMAEAIKLSLKVMRANKGGPFGAVVVKDGVIIARGFNRVTSTDDPTAHAEVVAIRKACQKLKTFQLTGCELYTSCEPCPMCLGAIYWARLDKVYYANTEEDAARVGFDDHFIYQELERPLGKRRLPIKQMMREEALQVFKEWEEKTDKVQY